jgi:hypothetical protein
MAKFIIVIDKKDIKTSRFGNNISEKCEGIELVFTPEALEELIGDYRSICVEEKEYGKNREDMVQDGTCT